jgi:hypothetical protein
VPLKPIIAVTRTVRSVFILVLPHSSFPIGPFHPRPGIRSRRPGARGNLRHFQQMRHAVRSRLDHDGGYIWPLLNCLGDFFCFDRSRLGAAGPDRMGPAWSSRHCAIDWVPPQAQTACTKGRGRGEELRGERVERPLAAILAADVAGYSRLMGQDEAGTLARLRTLRRELIDPKVAEHKGRIVKTSGDGIRTDPQILRGTSQRRCRASAVLWRGNRSWTAA